MIKAVILSIPLILLGSSAYAQSKESLFKIERNKNSNVVQYDANIDSNGVIDAENPIDAYWIMNEKGGAREEIMAFEKKAYGYKITKKKDHYDLRLNAVKNKEIKVFLSSGAAKAQIKIGGQDAYLSKVYVFAKEGALLPKVLYYTLTGNDVKTGAEVSEKIEASKKKETMEE